MWGAFVRTMLIGVIAVGIIPRVQAQWSASIHQLKQQAAARAPEMHGQLDDVFSALYQASVAQSSAGLNDAAPLPVANLPELGRLVSRF